MLIERKLINIKIIVILLVFLSPTLFFGFAADDRMFVLEKAAFHQDQLPILPMVIERLISSTRIVPISTILYSILFNAFDYQTAWLYHLYIIILTIFSAFVFLSWLNRIAKISSKDRIWVILIYLAATQFRLTYNDPIVSYHSLLQILSILFFYSLILLHEQMHGEHRFTIVLFAFIIILFLWTYELSVFLFPVYFFILFRERNLNRRKYVQAISILLALVISYLTYYLYLAIYNPSTYSGTKINFDLMKILLAFIWQLIGSLPLTYGVYFATQWFGFPIWIGWCIYFICAILIVVLLIRSRKLNEIDNEKVETFLVLGILIWFCAAAATALPIKYQQELHPGLAYLQVYVQNFGLAMVVFALFDTRRKAQKIGLTFLILVTFCLNLNILNEAKKIDGANVLTFKTISNRDIMLPYSFKILYLNEQVFYTTETLKRIAGDKIGEPVLWRMSYGVKKLKSDNRKTGIMLSENAWFGKGHLVIGDLNYSTLMVENVTIVTINDNRAKELAKIYGGKKINISWGSQGPLYSFQITNPIMIPGGLHGSFR